MRRQWETTPPSFLIMHGNSQIIKKWILWRAMLTWRDMAFKKSYYWCKLVRLVHFTICHPLLDYSEMKFFFYGLKIELPMFTDDQIHLINPECINVGIYCCANLYNIYFAQMKKCLKKKKKKKKCAKINLLELFKKLILFEFNSLCLLSNIEICKEEIMGGEIQC